MVTHGNGCKPSSYKIVKGVLRRYFRFRGMHGDCTLCLIAAIPSIAEWRLARLPDVLSDDELMQFLKAFDRKASTGKRDYAMGRCLINLGLQACEVAQLQLDDINWREGTLRLRANKMRREDVLPLPSQTGCAIIEYLKDDRPSSSSRCYDSAYFNVKLAQRFVLSLPRSRGRVGERETGMAGFIIRGSIIAMPVRLSVTTYSRIRQRKLRANQLQIETFYDNL